MQTLTLIDCLFVFFSVYFQTRRSRGYCFVYFDSLKSAQRAVDASVNLRIDSRYVRVDYSLTNRPRSPGSYERYKEELRSYSDSSRYRSTNRRGHSLSPRRKHLLDLLQLFKSRFSNHDSFVSSVLISLL